MDELDSPSEKIAEILNWLATWQLCIIQGIVEVVEKLFVEIKFTIPFKYKVLVLKRNIIILQSTKTVPQPYGALLIYM